MTEPPRRATPRLIDWTVPRADGKTDEAVLRELREQGLTVREIADVLSRRTMVVRSVGAVEKRLSLLGIGLPKSSPRYREPPAPPPSATQNRSAETMFLARVKHREQQRAAKAAQAQVLRAENAARVRAGLAVHTDLPADWEPGMPAPMPTHWRKRLRRAR